MAVPVVNIVIEQGADYSSSFTITNPDGSFAGNDANGLAGMDYWTKLKEYMPSGVTSWTWDGQGQDILQGGSAQTI